MLDLLDRGQLQAAGNDSLATTHASDSIPPNACGSTFNKGFARETFLKNEYVSSSGQMTLKRIVYLVASIVLLASTTLATAQNKKYNVERGLKNYEALISGRRDFKDLSSTELEEVFAIHKLMQEQEEAEAAARKYGSSTYSIQVSHNDEFFIINDEKFEAKTYCFNMEVGDSVVFVEGSANGACVSAKLYNARTEKICEVWCQ